MNDTLTLRVSFDKSLSPARRRVLAHLHEIAGPSHTVVVSYNEIARAVGYSRQTCTKSISVLEAGGYLTRDRHVAANGKDAPNTYHLHRVEG